MSTIVSLGRLLDGAVLSAFLVVVSGAALYALSLAHHAVVVTHKSKLGAFSGIVSKALPFDVYALFMRSSEIIFRIEG